MKRYLLDTNILLLNIKGSDLYKKIEKELDLNNIENITIISVVTKAELLSLGLQNKWGDNTLKKLNQLLRKYLSLV